MKRSPKIENERKFENNKEKTEMEGKLKILKVDFK